MTLQESKQQDVHLLQDVAQGNEKAECRFIQKYQPILMFTTRKYIRDKEVCKDLCQEALLAILQAARQNKIKKSLSAYAHQVCRNMIYGYIRKRGRDHQLLNPSGFDLLDDDQTGEADDERTKTLRKAWRRLTLKERRILNLYYIHNWSSTAVGDHLGISSDDVRTSAFRAKLKMNSIFKIRAHDNVTILIFLTLLKWIRLDRVA